MLTCSVCRHDYDSDQHLPKVIPTCGHTICLKCLSTILETPQPKECFECKSPFPLKTEKEWFQTNFALTQILEMMNNVCTKHKAPKDQVCLVDFQNICVNCANYDHDHHNHPIRSLQVVKIQAKRKIREINEKEKKFNEKARGQIQQILQKSHDNMNELISKTITKLKNDFAKKKRWFSWDIETLFALKKRKSIATDPQIRNFQEENASSCRKLASNIVNTDYLELLEQDIPQIPSYHQEQLKEFRTKVEIKVNMKKATTENSQETFQQENLFKDIMDETTPQERLRINLEIAKRRYFDLNFDDFGVLEIKPKESSQSFLEFKQSLTPEQVSKITKVSLNQEKTKFTDEMIQAVDTIWKDLANPTEVELNYSRESFDGDKDLTLASQFPFWEETQSSLTKLHLNFKDCLLNKTPFAKFLSQNLVKLQNLKELYLFRQRTKHIDDTLIDALTHQVLPSLNNLDTLCLWLDHAKITDTSIIEFCFQLKKLKTLSLSFFDTKISDNSLYTLSAVTFTKSSDLEELNLYFPCTRITPSGVHLFFKNLASKLTKLRILSLAFGEIAISENAIADLTYEFLKSASTLQELHLGFNDCQLSQDSLEMLCCYLPNQLSHLELGFYNESSIDQNVKTLVTESLRNMPNLTILGLRFFNTSLTKESLITLCSYLYQNTKIQNLVLDFTKAYIDDDSVCHFINRIVPSMPNLQYCQFYASNCPLINTTLDKIANLNSFYN